MNWDRQGSGRGPQRSIEEFLQDLFDKPQMMLMVIVVLILASAVFTSVYSVPPQEKAVITRLGRYMTTNDEGLHFKLPFGIDRVTLVPTKIQQEAFGFSGASARGSRSSLGSNSRNSLSQSSNNPFSRISSSNNGARNFDNESLMLTGDLNVADVDWVVQYRVKNPRQFLFNVRDPVKNIRDLSQTTMRQVVGDLSINDILTTGRRAIELQVAKLMQTTIDEKYEMGIEIQQVILQDVAPPKPVLPSFNQVNSAIQEQKQEINRALEQQNRVIGPAEGKANREISQARGYAEAVINRSVGDASRFNDVFAEYTKAPEVTRRRLYLELTEQIMQRVKNFTVVDPSIQGLLPIFNNATGSSITSQKDTRASIKPQALQGGAQ